MNEQIEKGYLELPNFKVDYQELIDEVKDIDSRNAWLENPANPDQIGSKDPYADYIQPVIPQTIKQNFKEHCYTWSGYVKCWPGCYLPPHEDTHVDWPSLHENEEAMALMKTKVNTDTWSNLPRECAIFFSVYGDFDVAPTTLYEANTKNKIVDLDFSVPTLMKCSGDIFHGVDNTKGGDRVTYQISFYGEYNFEKVVDMINNGELLN